MIVATTVFVAGSIRLMEPARWLETQTAPGVTVIPSGFVPTAISATTLLVTGSMRDDLVLRQTS